MRGPVGDYDQKFATFDALSSKGKPHSITCFIAAKAGIKIALTATGAQQGNQTLRFPVPCGHNLVCFDTDDKGDVFLWRKSSQRTPMNPRSASKNLMVGTSNMDK